MKKYLAVLATVATIALVVIAATSVWQVRQAANSCESLRDKTTRQMTPTDKIRRNRCEEYGNSVVVERSGGLGGGGLSYGGLE